MLPFPALNKLLDDTGSVTARFFAGFRLEYVSGVAG